MESLEVRVGRRRQSVQRQIATVSSSMPFPYGKDKKGDEKVKNGRDESRNDQSLRKHQRAVALQDTYIP